MDIDQWYNFFLMVGGGAADLAGLVFIAMLIDLSIIIRDATHKNPAIATLTGFTAVFMICAFASIGNIAGIYVASVAKCSPSLFHFRRVAPHHWHSRELGLNSR
jgi:hypothetical protein